jgi:hypothetical protein
MNDTPKNRSIVCCFCGAFWYYVEGVSDRDALIKIATEHEATCASNPYTTKIAQLERELSEARKQRNTLAEALGYIAHCGLSARHLEDYAKEKLAAVKGGDK